MQELYIKKRHGLFTLIALATVSTSTLSAKQLEVVTTQLILQEGQSISGKHFKCEGKSPYAAVIVLGNNVSIENSLFTGCSESILINGAKNTTIKGNRFEDIGLGIRINLGDHGETATGTNASFNEFRGVGTKDCRLTPDRSGRMNNYWACDAFLANARSSFGKFNNNLIDNRGKVTKYIEDIINIGDGSHDYEVKDNIVIGSSEPESRSSTAACIIADTGGSNFNISRNQCYNAATSGIANAGGHNFIATNNLVYIGRDHALGMRNHPIHSGQPSGDTTAFSTSPFAHRGCGQNAQFINNKAYAYYTDFANGILKDIGTAHNFEDGFGSCVGTYSLVNNEFHDEDPHWNIPSNIFSNLEYPYFSAGVNTTDTTDTTTPINTSETITGTELISGGGNSNGAIATSKWSYYGNTYGQQQRSYNGENFIYSTPKDVGSGMYQSFSTQVGKTYQVSAILIGSDTNRKESFNGASYLTISNTSPTQNGSSIIAESEKVTGGNEVTVTFSFTATSTISYLSLRSDAAWHYASARAISVIESKGTKPVTTAENTEPVATPIGIELISGGGNSNGTIATSKWSYYGNTYGEQQRSYNGENFIYSTPKDVGSGMYQSFSTEVGKTYQVSAILIGSDTNRKESFNGASYLTISNTSPTQNGSSIIAESEKVTAENEVTVTFSFTATSTISYLSLRSDAAWHYASARAISVKKQ